MADRTAPAGPTPTVSPGKTARTRRVPPSRRPRRQPRTARPVRTAMIERIDDVAPRAPDAFADRCCDQGDLDVAQGSVEVAVGRGSSCVAGPGRKASGPALVSRRAWGQPSGGQL